MILRRTQVMYFSMIPWGMHDILNEDLTIILWSILDIILTNIYQRSCEGPMSWLGFLKYPLKNKRSFEETNAIFFQGFIMKDSRHNQTLYWDALKDPINVRLSNILWRTQGIILMCFWLSFKGSRSIFKFIFIRNPLKDPTFPLSVIVFKTHGIILVSIYRRSFEWSKIQFNVFKILKGHKTLF